MTTISELMESTKKNNEKFVKDKCYEIIDNMSVSQRINFIKESNNIMRI